MSKIAVISQPRYLPSLNYFHRMMLADEFVFLDSVQYTPRDWENRNKIKSNNNEIWLTVSVEKAKREVKIQDTYISKQDKKWANKHLQSIITSYKKTPFFNDHFEFLEDMYSRNWIKLVDLNVHFINYVCSYLEIECKFSFSSAMDINSSGEELLMDICDKIGAKKYISGPLGNNYINLEKWKSKGIDLVYHNYEYPVYEQGKGDFVPWLSVIDILMYHGKKSKQIIGA